MLNDLSRKSSQLFGGHLNIIQGGMSNSRWAPMPSRVEEGNCRYYIDYNFHIINRPKQYFIQVLECSNFHQLFLTPCTSYIPKHKYFYEELRTLRRFPRGGSKRCWFTNMVRPMGNLKQKQCQEKGHGTSIEHGRHQIIPDYI